MGGMSKSKRETGAPAPCQDAPLLAPEDPLATEVVGDAGGESKLMRDGPRSAGGTLASRCGGTGGAGAAPFRNELLWDVGCLGAGPFLGALVRPFPVEPKRFS